MDMFNNLIICKYCQHPLTNLHMKKCMYYVYYMANPDSLLDKQILYEIVSVYLPLKIKNNEYIDKEILLKKIIYHNKLRPAYYYLKLYEVIYNSNNTDYKNMDNIYEILSMVTELDINIIIPVIESHKLCDKYCGKNSV